MSTNGFTCLCDLRRGGLDRVSFVENHVIPKVLGRGEAAAILVQEGARGGLDKTVGRDNELWAGSRTERWNKGRKCVRCNRLYQTRTQREPTTYHLRACDKIRSRPLTSLVRTVTRQRGMHVRRTLEASRSQLRRTERGTTMRALRIVLARIKEPKKVKLMYVLPVTVHNKCQW